MEIELVDQPAGELLCDRLRPLLADAATSGLLVASAWVRRPGLALIAPEVAALRARLPARAVRGLFGIDLGGTTVEGLETALASFGTVRVFHSAGQPRRTFHPKVYVVEQVDRAVVCIGSANLTFGGIGGNFETAALVTLDLEQDDDRAFLDQVRGWYERLWDDPDAAIPLTNSRLGRLVADPAVWVPREREARKLFRTAGSGGRRGDRGSLFNAPRGLPPLPRVPTPDPIDDEPEVTVVEAIPIEELATPADAGKLRALLAYVPHDRWRQVGFSRAITEGFFRVFNNGDIMWTEGVTQTGRVLAARTAKLINPTGSNDNHRIELPEPDGRPNPQPDRGIVVVLERSLRSFRYMHLRPGDRAYDAMAREIAARPAFGLNRKPDTKRVSLRYGELRAAWPGACPLRP